MRFPRVFMSVFVGASLSASGSVYQSIFNNKLVSPDLLGVSEGSCVGAALAILVSGSLTVVMVNSFIFGFIAVICSLQLPKLIGNTSNISLLLSGIVISAIFSSFLGLIKYAVDSLEKLESITFWIMGSFSYVSLKDLIIVVPILIMAMAILILCRYKINILSLGLAEAQLLGVDYKLIRLVVIISSTVLTSCSTALCGTVSWIGLIVPNITRMLVGSNNMFLIPFSTIIGALLLPIIDTLCRTLTVNEIPISIISGLFGAVTYGLILIKKGKYLYD